MTTNDDVTLECTPTTLRRSPGLDSRLEQLIATVPCVICSFKRRLDGGFCFPYASPAIEEIYGMSPEELKRDASPVFQLIHPADRTRVKHSINESARTQDPWRDEFRVRSPGKGEIWIEGHSLPQRELDGSVVWHGYISDITHRKKTEGALKQRESLLRAVLDCTADGILVVSEEGRILSANPRFMELWRIPMELVELGSDELLLGHVTAQLADPDGFTRQVKQLYGTDIESRDLLHFKDGRTYERLSRPLMLDGQRIGRLWSFRDITQRERAVEALRRSEALLRDICDGTTDPIFVKDRAGRLVLANPASLRTIGRPAEAVLGKTSAEIWRESGVGQAILENDLHVMETGRTDVLEETLQTPEGPRVFLSTKTPQRDGEGGVIGLIGVARDITQRKRMEDALRQSEAGLAAAQRLARLGNWEIAVTSLEPLVLDPLIWSEEIFRIFGYDPIKTETSNENFLRAVHPQDLELVRSAIRGVVEQRIPCEIEHRVLRPDGTERFVQQHAELICDQAGRPVKIVGTVQDITERQRAEETRQRLEAQLRQAQKMEAIGQLAGGVAHDFNNLLTVILGNTELLAEDAALSPDRQELTRQVAEAARRAANLTRQLLAFSRRQVMQMQRVDVNEVVANVYKMLHRLLGEQIALQCNYGTEIPPIEADTGMVEQVIMNLAINARDAMPAGGKLVLTTQCEQVDSTAVARNPEAKEGRFVTLEVTDTGCGMDPVTLARLFEPFFTTKEVGKGTGLGLATVYGIIKQHNAWLEVTSHVGKGSTFKIFFPATTPEPVSADGHQPKPLTGLAGGNETILLVEDEAAVRLLVQTCLSRLGYRVLPANNGPEALRVWQEHSHQIDLILTDLVMPEGMSGRDLAQQLRGKKPGLRVIYSSGYSRELMAAESNHQPGECFLPKPYEFTTLAQTVRRCFDCR